MTEECINLLKTLCFFRDVGIYNAATEGIQTLEGDDFYELLERGLDAAAPIARRDEVPMGDFDTPLPEGPEDEEIYEDCDHFHSVLHYSSPAMQEYFRLCRLYEYREGICPKDNPFVGFASDAYEKAIRMTSGQFGASFNDDTYTTELLIETCPEWCYDPMEIIQAVVETLKFFDENLPVLARELAKSPFLFLPELPAKTERRQKEAQQ
jgi:hypothetical protein